MTPATMTHVKHLLIAVVICVVVWFGVSRWSETRMKLAQIESASAEKIKANDAQAATALSQAAAANQQIDATTKAKLDGLQAQLNSKPTTEQIWGIVQSVLPGVQVVQAKDQQGNAVIAVADTQANRDAINQADVSFKSCKFNLDDCQQKSANNLAALNVVIAAKQSTIEAQTLEIKQLKEWGKGGNFWSRTGRVALPVACAGAGAWLGANKGTKGAAVGALAGGGACALVWRF